MTNRLECAGVVLEGVRTRPFERRWYVDGEPMPDAEHAVETFFARIYGSSQELPTAITTHIRKFAGLQLFSPGTMVRRARERGGFKSQREFARAAEVDHSTVSRIERHEIDPRVSTLANLMHAADGR